MFQSLYDQVFNIDRFVVIPFSLWMFIQSCQLISLNCETAIPTPGKPCTFMCLNCETVGPTLCHVTLIYLSRLWDYCSNPLTALSPHLYKQWACPSNLLPHAFLNCDTCVSTLWKPCHLMCLNNCEICQLNGTH